VEVVRSGLVDVTVEEELRDPMEDVAGRDGGAADDVLERWHGEDVREEKGGEIGPVAELHGDWIEADRRTKKETNERGGRRRHRQEKNAEGKRKKSVDRELARRST
jgi:hypothetical protein